MQTNDAQPRPQPGHKAQQAAVGVMRTADVVRRHIQSVVEPFGITLQQFNVLRILRGAGGRGLPTLTIGERMIERTPGVTRLVDRLVKKGLVGRTPCVEDKRRIYCCITPAGLRLLSRLDEPVRQADVDSVARLSQADLSTLIELLGRLRAETG